METKNETFKCLLRSTKREGVDNLIENLSSKGFFEAPASTVFHLNKDGGLVEHSLNVYMVALKLRESMIDFDSSLQEKLPKDSIIIASLLHDICKADIYKKTVKRQKNSKGQWGDVEGFETDYSNFPVGHGEKSVIMALQAGFKLTKDEILAIRWHMHSWDLPFQSADIKANLNVAKKQCPLIALIIAADGLASNLLEK